MSATQKVLKKITSILQKTPEFDELYELKKEGSSIQNCQKVLEVQSEAQPSFDEICITLRKLTSARKQTASETLLREVRRK